MTTSTRSESSICRRAYESLDPLSRYDPNDDPDKPKSPLYHLEKIYSSTNDIDKLKLYSKNIIQKYLNPNDPFMLLTHNPQTKLTEQKLTDASQCIWKQYYAKLATGYDQTPINEMRKKSSITSQDNYDKLFNIKKGFIDFSSIQPSFQTFIQYVLDGQNLNVINDQVSQHCSAFMNPSDVFFPCQTNCIEPPQRTSHKNLSQPRIMQEELTKFDDTLKKMHNFLMEIISKTKTELKSELLAMKVHPQRIKEIVDEKFGTITHVPDSNDETKNSNLVDVNLSSEAQNEKNNRKEQEVKSKRRKEAEKKRRQKLQNKLIKRVISRGKVDPKYKALFALETPFNLTDKGKQISKTTGLLKTKYDRINKRIELQLRFKGNQALKNTQARIDKIKESGDTKTKNYQTLSEKLTLLKELAKKPHTDKPLKLKLGKKTTVAKGGDRAKRHIISLFGVREFKDKMDDMKQKYVFTTKTERVLGFDTRVPNQTHPQVSDFKYFDFKDLEKTVDSLFIKFLNEKTKDSKIFDLFDIGELKTYEKIDIPFVDFRLEYNNRTVEFSRAADVFINNNNKSKLDKDGLFTINRITPNSTTSRSLTYKFNPRRNNENAPFVNYDEAVRLVRQFIRSRPKNEMFNRNDHARFYLRNEDKFRMEPITNILNVLNLHNKLTYSLSSANSSSSSPTKNSSSSSSPTKNSSSSSSPMRQSSSATRTYTSPQSNSKGRNGRLTSTDISSMQSNSKKRNGRLTSTDISSMQSNSKGRNGRLTNEQKIALLLDNSHSL